MASSSCSASRWGSKTPPPVSSRCPTTVLTLTIVGIAADSRLVGGSGSRAGRRLIAVAAMLVGALAGSLLIFHVSIVSPLVIALIVMAIVAVTTRVLSSTDPAWVRAS